MLNTKAQNNNKQPRGKDEQRTTEKNKAGERIDTT